MDQLTLQSTFAKLRNPYGLRRWAYMESSDNPGIDFRISQLFGHSGQPYGENNAPMLVTRVIDGETLAQVIPFRDQWERPAKRWFKGNLVSGVFSTPTGTPFLAEDPFQTTVQYKAKVGDDVFLDDGAGTTHSVKISAVGASGNSVAVTTKQGGTLPPDGTYYAQHTLDAFLVRLTVAYMIPQTQFPSLDPTVQTTPFQSKIQVTYYDNAGSTVTELYARTPIRELSTIAADVPFAFIEVVGDRFDVATAPLTPYYQIFETFEFQLARAPDKLEVLFDNTGPTGGGNNVHVGHAAVYYGITVPAAAAVPSNIFPPNPNPAPTTRYNLYPPPDPEDFWTGSGDIVVMPVGTVCPVGYEDIAQVLSKANDHYVIDTATGRPITFSLFSGGNDLQMSLVDGNTKFTGVLPATARDPSNPNTALNSAQNNTSTFEVVFLLYLFNGAFAVDQVLSFRIQEIHFSAAGTFDFTLPGDLRQLVGNSLTSAIDCRLFVSGAVKADSLASAGVYSKPVQDAEDATAVEDPGASEAAFDDQFSIPLDTVLISVGDVIEFVDEDKIAVPQVAVGPDFTGPDFVVTAINTDENTVTVQDRRDVDGDPNRTTEVWHFVASTAGGGGVPPVFMDNFFKVYAANTAHTHQVLVSDADLKSRKTGGHFVTSLDHVHAINAESVIVPYTQFKFCVKL